MIIETGRRVVKSLGLIYFVLLADPIKLGMKSTYFQFTVLKTQFKRDRFYRKTEYLLPNIRGMSTLEVTK